ncbi:MAG TPA: nitroreductase family deazaflavin-dependent oxidoreductase [Candidatus Dormibacteraeota bacterium]
MSATRPPVFVRLFNPVARRLLGGGVPMGPNGLLTVRGRTSGQPRTTAVGVLEVGGRRWLIGAYGHVNWVRNLRAAGEGVIEMGRRSQPIRSVELSPQEATAFFRDVLAPFMARQPLPLRLFVGRLLREPLTDPVRAASKYPVFEVHQAAPLG